MTTATLDHKNATSVGKSWMSSQAARQRTLDRLRREIDFIPNRDFSQCDELSESIVAATLEEAGGVKAPAELPTHLRRMCEAKLLTHEQESALFREMNYLKFRANSLRSRLDPDHVDGEAIATIDQLLRRAQAILDHIIQANTRLAMSIVKKYVTPQQSFDDLLSDSLLTLMQAVEKFDYDRGFRFSTYAYRSITRNTYRTITSARKEESRLTRDAEAWAFEQEDDYALSTTVERVWSNLRELTSSMLDQLDRRERFIIRSRYALGAHRKVRTFQSLADKLGVSKERVRQLEQRAVNKLRTLAADLEMDELFSASMV